MVLKVGVVGVPYPGGIGIVHARCYVKDPLSELVAVCDIVKERADNAAKHFGVRGYYNIQDMLENETDLDIVDVSTGGDENGSLHYKPAMLALEAGKNVLVEKPLSNDIYEARAMVEKARQKNVYLGCNLNHYFTPPSERAKKYIEDQEIGELIYCLHKMGFPGGEATYSGPSSSPRIRPYPYFHVKAFLAHPFSVMRFFCGDIKHIQAFLSRPSYRKKSSDLMLSVNSIHIKFTNDCVGYLLSTRGDSVFGLGGWWSIEVGGTIGTFCIENCIEKVTYWPSPKPASAAQPAKLKLGGTKEPTVSNSGIKDFQQTFPRRIHAFLKDITNNVYPKDLRASGRDALATLEYTWAVIESYEQGGKLVRPHPLPPI
jgi:predicted dehydrogenase